MFALKDLTNSAKDDQDNKSSISNQDIIANRIFTEEDAMNLIDELCVGYSAEQAVKSVDQMIRKIRNHVLEIDSTLPDGIFGRNVHEYISHSMKLAGDSVISCVKSNLSLERMLSNVRTSKSILDNELHDLEKKLIIPVQPNETYLKSKYRVQKADELEFLQREYRERYEKSTRLKIKEETVVEDEENEKMSGLDLKKTKRQARKEQKRDRAGDADTSKKGLETSRVVDHETLTWDNSPQYFSLQTAAVDLVNRLDLEFDREYVTELRDYQLQQSTFRNLTAKVKELQEQVRYHTVSEIFINGLQTVMVTIATAVCNAVRKYPGIRAKLEGQVTLSNGERMVDPLGQMSLPGIYSILYRDYSKASLDIFCTMLLQLMSEDQGYEASINNPELGVQKILQQLRAWEQLDLYACMSKDKLFTVALLKSYHPKSDVRTRGVTVVIEYVRRLEIGEVCATVCGDHSDMPIFLHLTDWIDRVLGVSKKFGKGEAQNSYSNSTGANDKKTTKPNQNWNVRKTPGTAGYEQAAAAQVTPATSDLGTGPDAKGPYVTGVGREASLQITMTEGAGAGRRVPYTATQAPCLQCYDVSTREKKKTGNHKPYCYNGQCSKCHLYGHRYSQCCQQLPKEQAAQQG